MNLTPQSPQSSQSISYQEISGEIESFIQQPKEYEGCFNSLALRIYQYQRDHNLGYAKFCNSLPEQNINDWKNIPALTTETFKLDPKPTCLEPDERLVTFMTSGTTGDVRGHHYFRNTKVYATSILNAWKQLNLPQPKNLLILNPSPADAPHSSLSFMIDILRHEYCPNAEYLIDHDTLNLSPLFNAINEQQPITLFGTALAFLRLFETIPDKLQLPAGSWAIETGGYKGSGRTLTKENLYHKFEFMLGITNYSIWNEYSMTELSSQAYTQAIGNPHKTPHWMKIQVHDPETGEPVSAGNSGYLTLYDLANVDSISALRTQDIAIYHNEHSFTLVGRDPAAVARGCSRSIDELLD